MAVKLTDAQIRLLGERRSRTAEMLPALAAVIFGTRPQNTVDGSFLEALKIMETQSDIDRQLDHAEALHENAVRAAGWRP